MAIMSIAMGNVEKTIAEQAAAKTTDV